MKTLSHIKNIVSNKADKSLTGAEMRESMSNLLIFPIKKNDLKQKINITRV